MKNLVLHTASDAMHIGASSNVKCEISDLNTHVSVTMLTLKAQGVKCEL